MFCTGDSSRKSLNKDNAVLFITGTEDVRCRFLGNARQIYDGVYLQYRQNNLRIVVLIFALNLNCFFNFLIRWFIRSNPFLLTYYEDLRKIPLCTKNETER